MMDRLIKDPAAGQFYTYLHGFYVKCPLSFPPFSEYIVAVRYSSRAHQTPLHSRASLALVTPYSLGNRPTVELVVICNNNIYHNITHKIRNLTDLRGIDRSQWRQRLPEVLLRAQDSTPLTKDELNRRKTMNTVFEGNPLKLLTLITGFFYRQPGDVF